MFPPVCVVFMCVVFWVHPSPTPSVTVRWTWRSGRRGTSRLSPGFYRWRDGPGPPPVHSFSTESETVDDSLVGPSSSWPHGSRVPVGMDGVDTRGVVRGGHRVRKTDGGSRRPKESVRNRVGVGVHREVYVGRMGSRRRSGSGGRDSHRERRTTCGRWGPATVPDRSRR